MANDILVIDDEADIRNLVRDVLRDHGHGVRVAANVDDAREELAKRHPSLMLLDMWLEHSSSDGLDFFREVHAHSPMLPIVLISGHGTLEMATTAMRDGAVDFIAKPFNTDVLLHSVNRALTETRVAREHLDLLASFGGLLDDYSGDSFAVKELRKAVDALSDKPNARALLLGDSGTGKALTAWLIHLRSRGRESPFITLHCEENLEGRYFAEALFGAETTNSRTLGAFEKAHGGSVLMRHIDRLSLESQGILLQALQRNYFRRLGGEQKVETDSRVMATARKDLREMVGRELFNKELYHRLNVFTIEVPSLKKRREDIGQLASAILGQLCGQRGWPRIELTRNALSWLSGATWQGNIWQLRAVLETSLFLSHGKSSLDIDILRRATEGHWRQENDLVMQYDSWYKLPLREARQEFERDYLVTLLNRCEGNVSEVARHSKFERAALHRKLSSLQIARQHKDDK